MLQILRFVNKAFSRRRCMFVLCSLCVGVITLQLIFVNHMYHMELNTEHIHKEVLFKYRSFNGSSPKIDVDFTVNDVLDHMMHEVHGKRHGSGDFVKSTFDDKLPSFMTNLTKRNFRTEPLKVIVVPHSQTHPWYKKTFSETFAESSSNILSLAVEKLSKYHDMTFIWSEVCFIEKWWNYQNKTTRDKFKYLVKSGRLELTSGAWVTPDEATPHYFAYLDQMVEGHVWVKRHLGVTPDVSFDTGQFSLSSSVRFLMKEAGIKNVVVKRLHMGMKDYFMKHMLMNFYWKIATDSNNKGLFVQVEPYERLSFHDSCGPSRAVCADLDLGHDIELPVPGTPEVDKPIRLLHHRYSSLSSFADKVVRQLKLKSSGYLHNVLLLPHGEDYRYSTANDWDNQYQNINILMQYINSNEKYNVRMDFGTLKDYFAEIKRKSEVYQSQYPTVSGDFVPFTLGLQYWSGFFTTRQYLKRLGRTLQESIRAADILVALIVLNGKADEMSPERITSILRKLVDARRELDLFQHYDAITGTSKTGVVKDYGEKLSSAVSMSKQVMAFFVEHVIYGSFPIPQTKDENVDSENNLDRDALQSPCGKFSLLSSVVKLSDVGRTRGSDNITNLILYNSFTQERSEIVAFSVSSPYIKITDQTGESFKFDYLLCGELRSLIFFEIRLPPLSISSFRFSKSVHSLSGKPVSVTSYDTSENGNLICENNQVNITFSPYDGSPEMICYKNENFCTHLEIHWRHFFHTGGAYTLSLNNESKDLLKTGLKLRKISGSKQCVVELSHKLINVEYVLKNTFGVNGRHLQVNVLTDLSSSNSGNFVGELAMEVVTSIKNGDTFFTDSNGLQLLRRKFRKSMPFSSNVYPMTSMAAITDGTRRFTIHSVQPHGVVAREPGILDILIDRVASRAEMDLSQKVMDNKPTLTKLFVQFEECESSKTGTSSEVLTPSHEAVITNDLVQHPIVSFFSTKRSPLDRTTISFLEKKVACDMVIANMKCLTNANFEVDGVTLTLFRRPVSTCNSLPKQCGVQSKYTSLSPGKLFQTNSNKYWSVKEMFLTHLKIKRILPFNGNVSFAEMDMKTFLFE